MNCRISQTSNRRGITIIEVIVVIIVLLMVAALMLPKTCRAREAARRTQCRNNMKNIGLALNNYENKFGIFPPAMTIADAESIVGGCDGPYQRTGGFSWRVLILPDIEEQKIYDQIKLNGTAGVFDCSGKNGPPNADWTSALKTQINAFLCPSDPTLTDTDDGWHGSNYAAMISKVADYRYQNNENEENGSRLTDISLLHPEKPAKQSDVANDGTSHTIMIVEVDRGVKVAQRGRVVKADHHRCGRWFNSQGCYADALRTPDDFGTYREPKQDETSFDNPVVWNFFDGPLTNGWGRAASSPHGGGAHVGMVDGSVQWVTKRVDLQLYRATCTREGGETETIEF